MLLGIDNKKVNRAIYASDQVTLLKEDKMTLIDFAEWYGRAVKRNAHITQNGVNSIIVITENRYFVIYIKD